MAKEAKRESESSKKTISEFVKNAGFNVDPDPQHDDPVEDGGNPNQPNHSTRLNQKEIAKLYRILSRKNFHKNSVKKCLVDMGYVEPTKQELDELKRIRQDVKDTFCDEKY